MASASYIVVLFLISAVLLSQVSGFRLDDNTFEDADRTKSRVRGGAKSRLRGGCFNLFGDNICGEIIKRDLDCSPNGKRRMNKFAKKYCRKLCGFC